ncbi:hypothetical protein GCM10009624_00860 [Gordonia sinesedis]
MARPTGMTTNEQLPPTFITRSAALRQRGITDEAFAAEFRHFRGGTYVDRAALLTAREFVIGVANAAEGEPVVAGAAATIMHESAWYDEDFSVELIRMPGSSGRPACATVTHRLDLDPADVVEIDGIRVTNAIRTAFDIARVKPAWRALGYLDALARATRFNPVDLAVYADMQKWRRNVRQARELARIVDAAAESPGESGLRLLVVRSDLPTPDLQIVVADQTGMIIARIDLGYAALKVGIEYDGEEFHSSPQQRADDQRRQDKLTELGWIIIRVDRERMRTNPFGIILEIDRAIRSRGGHY